jgi:hypothetical protein
MPKPPLFAGAANASNTVDLLSDSLDDEDLRTVSTFARRPASMMRGGPICEDDVTKKPVSHMKNDDIPQPAVCLHHHSQLLSVQRARLVYYSHVGVAASSK